MSRVVAVSRRRPLPLVGADVDADVGADVDVAGRVTPSHVDGVRSCGMASENDPSASAAVVPGAGPVAAAYAIARLNR